MSSEQSERIRAALLRTKTSQPVSELVSPAAGQQDAATIFGKQAESGPSFADPAEVGETAEPEETQEVEEILPLIGASEEARAVFRGQSGTAESPDNFQGSLAPRAQAGPSRPKFARNISIACGAAALAGLSVFLIWGPWKKAAPPSAPAARQPLELNVESQGNGIVNIRWNTQSEAVAKAREGRMVITERDQQPRIISLGPEQLKIGHLYYQSPADRVEFGLEVVEPDGAVAKESVLAVSSGSAAQAEAGPPVAQVPAPPTEGKPEPAPTQPAPTVEAKAEAPRIEKAAAPERASRPAARAFTPPSIGRKSEETRVVVLEPPAVTPSGSVAPPVSLPDVAARIAPPPGKEAPAATPKQIKLGGNLQAANLIKQVPPVYPPAARSLGVEGTVRFTATIGKDGTIQHLQALSGHPMLVSAATEAVKKWVYRPMLLNGEPVEVVTQIDVNFALRK